MSDRRVAVNLTNFKIKMGKQRLIHQFVAGRGFWFEIHADYAFLYQCKNPNK